jgi:tRNA wybutosine-synthesizing protein 1
MSPTVGFCHNRCIHCWRAIELTDGNKINGKEVDKPKDIIDGCIKQQRKLIIGFKGNPKVNIKKFQEAQEPMHFAISLTGEPTLYLKIGELINELRKRGKTTFLVTNGLEPEVLKKLGEKKQLPTQLYVSINTPNKELYEKWHRSSEKDPWKKFNQTLELLPKLKTRKVLRMTLVKNLNMNSGQIKDYVELMKKAKPDFIEVKGFMSVGYARKRLGYEMMPSHEEIKDFAKKLVKFLGKPYKILDEHEISRIMLIGKDKKKMKIQKNQI